LLFIRFLFNPFLEKEYKYRKILHCEERMKLLRHRVRMCGTESRKQGHSTKRCGEEGIELGAERLAQRRDHYSNRAETRRREQN